MDLATLASLLTAVGVSGLVVNWVAEGKARRQFRGDALKVLTEVESRRWAGQQHSYREFARSLNDLQTAALVARIPRRAVHQYLILADVARRVSDDSFKELDEDFDAGAGGINSQFASLVRDTADVIARLAWEPTKSRFWLTEDLKKIRTKVESVHDDDVLSHLAISQRVHGPLPGPLGQLPMQRRSEPMSDLEMFGDDDTTQT